MRNSGGLCNYCSNKAQGNQEENINPQVQSLNTKLSHNITISQDINFKKKDRMIPSLFSTAGGKGIDVREENVMKVESTDFIVEENSRKESNNSRNEFEELDQHLIKMEEENWNQIKDGRCECKDQQTNLIEDKNGMEIFSTLSISPFSNPFYELSSSFNPTSFTSISTSSSSSQISNNSSSPFPKLDEFILKIVSREDCQSHFSISNEQVARLSCDGGIRRVDWSISHSSSSSDFSDFDPLSSYPTSITLNYQISHFKFCENVGRCHKSNHISLLVDLMRGSWSQSCLGLFLFL